MANFIPAIILSGYGVTDIQSGDTIDPTFLPASAVAWGAVTGTLSSQTDLNSALNGKEPAITAGTTAQYLRGDKSLATLDKTAVGLGSVDNVADASKPVSTAQSSAIAAKSDLRVVQTSAPATGATTTFGTAKKDEQVALTHVATIAAHTLVFPTDANSQIGQELSVFARSIITVVTLTLNSNTILGTALTTLPAFSNARWRKTAASTWCRVQ